jgi:Tol biopolymer transport system component
MMKQRLLWLMLACVPILSAQLKTLSIEPISLPATERWSHPVFAPDGKGVFITTSEYNGIWYYSFDAKVLKELTRDKHSGFAFSVSPDGATIGYRRTVQEGDHITRVQESIEMSVVTGTSTVLERGNSVHPPVFIGTTVVSSDKQLQKITNRTETAILGIDEKKISLLTNGQKKIFDPLRGQYIWPKLSPDAKSIVAVEMDRGAFVAAIDGSNVQLIGKCNAPVWTRDGKWVIGMDDKDDGHVIYNSEIIAVAPDASKRINLTEAFSSIAMYPAASPTDNSIVFNTTDGKVFILRYEEGQ